MLFSYSWLKRIACASIIGVTAACGDLTAVAAPDIVQPGDLNSPAGALARAAGAVTSFNAGTTQAALLSGTLVDEFTDVSRSVLIGADRRIVQTQTNPAYPYDELSLARISAILAIASMHQYQPADSAHVAELFAFLGFIDVQFAEHMCSGVPVGSVVNGAGTYGPTWNRGQLLSDAVVEFDSASRYAVHADSVLNLARVGQGRAFLDAGAFASADNAVASVPVFFAYSLGFGQPQPLNVLQVYVSGSVASVANDKGTNGLNFVTANDPRVFIQNLGLGSDQLDSVYTDTSISSTSFVLASGVEANLIHAEAQLQSNNIAAWAAALNALRISAISPAMDTLTSDSTAAASSATRLAVLYRERAFWLFGTGHRLGDLRREIWYYGLSANSLFPVGTYPTGVPYGTDTYFRPFGEQSNPNFHGCNDAAR